MREAHNTRIKTKITTQNECATSQQAEYDSINGNTKNALSAVPYPFY